MKTCVFKKAVNFDTGNILNSYLARSNFCSFIYPGSIMVGNGHYGDSRGGALLHKLLRCELAVFAEAAVHMQIDHGLPSCPFSVIIPSHRTERQEIFFHLRYGLPPDMEGAFSTRATP